MKIINCALQEFVANNKDRGIYCFGAGNLFRQFYNNMAYWDMQDNVIAVIDNNKSQIGEKIICGTNSYEVISFDELPADSSICIVITLTAVQDVLEQCKSIDAECYIVQAMYAKQCMTLKTDFPIRSTDAPLIPRKIHYCWFGKSEMPDKFKRYIESWRKFCPDYEIKEWNESNYDITKNQYMLQAYEKKVWGFVPDYARLDIVYNEGGIYLDTDVELVKGLDDLLYNHAFFVQAPNNHIVPGIGFGAQKGNELVREMRDYYETVNFCDDNGNCDLTVCDIHQAKVLEKYGYRYDGVYQIIKDSVIFPKVLDGMQRYEDEIKITDKTYLIHYGVSTWWKKDMMRQRNSNVTFLHNMIKDEIAVEDRHMFGRADS